MSAKRLTDACTMMHASSAYMQCLLLSKCKSCCIHSITLLKSNLSVFLHYFSLACSFINAEFKGKAEFTASAAECALLPSDAGQTQPAYTRISTQQIDKSTITQPLGLIPYPA